MPYIPIKLKIGRWRRQNTQINHNVGEYNHNLLFVILYYYTIFVFCGRYYYMERKNQILFKYYFPWIMEDVGAINCDWFWFLDKLVRNFIKIWKILDLINTNPRSNPSFGFSRFIQFKPTQEWKWLNIFSWLICHSSPFLLQIQLNVICTIQNNPFGKQKLIGSMIFIYANYGQLKLLEITKRSRSWTIYIVR